MIRQLGRALLAVAFVAGALEAQVVTIPYNKLYTVPSGATSYLYTGLDLSGTTLNVSTLNGGIFNPITSVPGPSSFPGLWFGSNQSSATYTFTFNRPVTFFEFYITAQSTFGNLSEVFNGFTVNSGTPSFAFTSVSGTAWDGSNLTSTQNDGRSLLAISVGAGQSFTSVSFDHVQVGAPNGSVIEQIRYDATPTNVVPEPSTYALMAVGLIALGAISKRRVARSNG